MFTVIMYDIDINSVMSYCYALECFNNEIVKKLEFYRFYYINGSYLANISNFEVKIELIIGNKVPDCIDNTY